MHTLLGRQVLPRPVGRALEEQHQATRAKHLLILAVQVEES